MFRRLLLVSPCHQDAATFGILGRKRINLSTSRSYLTSHALYRKEVSISSQFLIPRTDHLQSQASSQQQYLPAKATNVEVEKDAIEAAKYIKNCQTVSEILEVIEGLNSKTMDDQVVLEGIGTLFQLCKHEKSTMIKKDILNSVGMQKLCKMLRYRGRWMDVNSLLTSAKLLVFLNSPPSNTTLEIIFRLLSKQANALTLQEISYLHFLLDKTSETPLVSALKLALPVVFESQISIQLNRDNLPSLVSNLCYAVGYDLSENTITTLIAALAGRAEELTPNQAMIILWELSELRNTSQFNNADFLVKTCFSKMTSSIDKFSTSEISTTVGKVAKKVQHGGRNLGILPFYNEDFVETVCNVLVKRKSDKLPAIYNAKSISLMRHVNIEYLDYITDVLIEDPSILLNSDQLYLSTIRAFSMANYKPEKSKLLDPILVEHPCLTKVATNNKSTISLLKIYELGGQEFYLIWHFLLSNQDLAFQEIAISADLLALDIFPSSLISKIFSEEYYTRLDAYLEKGSPYLLMLVYNTVKLLYPNYNGVFPPISMVQKWKNMLLRLPKLYPLKGALESGFGGESYVINGVFHEGFHIDHAIIMRKGGFPIAIHNCSEPTLVSNLQLPPDSVIVMVKAFLQESYANNTTRMRGTNALELKVIEKFGHPIIPIDITRWRALQDYEKIPFLMHRIRDKLDKCWSQSNGSNF